MKTYDALTAAEKIGLLKTMYTSRFFEEQAEKLNEEGYVHGTLHLAIGQEANHAGVSAALNSDDWIIGTHRGHGHYIGKGGSPEAMLAEICGLADGIGKGLCGSMHFTDLANHNMGTSAIVGGSLPLAVGMAMALKYKEHANIVTAFMGDGAINQGMSMEAFNLASVWGAPVLFYCENNGYAISSRAEKFIAAEHIYQRAESFLIKSARIDGNDVTAVFDAVSAAAEYIRREKKPYFIQADTCRWRGHSRTDSCEYRSRAEEESYRGSCPIARYESRLVHEGVLSEAQADELKNCVCQRAAAAARSCVGKYGDALDTAAAEQFVYTKQSGEELWAK